MIGGRRRSSILHLKLLSRVRLFVTPWTKSMEFSRPEYWNGLPFPSPENIPNPGIEPRLPCPSPSPRAYSNSCPLSQWCHPTISSTVVPSSSCPQSFPASGSFQWVSSPHQVAKVLELHLQHPYITTGETIALTRWTFVSKVTSLLFNMMSRLVITFLPRSKHLLISWLHSLSAVILEPKKIKFVTISIFSLLFAMKYWDQMPWS